MKRNVALLLALAFVLALVPLANANAQDKVVVTWFIGLGTGTNVDQIPVQEAVAKKFNESQTEIELKLNIAASNQAAPDVLSTLIAAGDAPDIVGPVGWSGANLFAGQYLDLKPLVEKMGYDLSQYPEALVKQYESPEGLIGIPFAVFPGVLYINKDLFDEAGLAYPPTEFGAKYMLNGEEVDWTWDTLVEVAKILTVDANGEDATSDAFDPTKIVQYGFDHQWDTIRADFDTFGGNPFYDAATGKVTVPDNWHEHAKFMYNAIWVDHFMPNNTAVNSDLLKPHPFASGKIAMSRTMLWYTCCLADLKSNWDLAVVPSYKGNYYSVTDMDTFRIMKASKNPEAAFKVLTYLQGEAALDLLKAYGAYPGLPELQEPFIKGLQEKYPSVQNWGVAPASMAYAISVHESYYPNFAKGQLRFADFATLLRGDQGASIDVDAELDKLAADLQTIIDEVKK
ncbi:hypothetical protein ANRL4_02913 [Anaerolineae bacterium]|nr:hypothetical protein ANRL4_02913 [Anaerolineae bacterium]